MASADDQGVCPVSFLVDDTCPLSVIVKPRCAGLPREALNSAKSRVLIYYELGVRRYTRFDGLT